ncbi:hypothetical protein ABZX12_17605 [Kribbella sp. NPDC003505]|uniref:hypothetical protein n=1 Tax=Kribbella sp. NPDC003505 TaxID=3154448 RepID=UPI0033B1B26A
MTLGVEQVSAEIANALSQPVPDDLVRAVKSVVRRELEELSPDASVTPTEYYNHSYIPDMVVEWGGGSGPRRKREIFIRQSLRSYSIQRDLDVLSDREPVVLGLANARDEDERVDATVVREAMPEHARTLVTEVNTMAAMTAEPAPVDSSSPDIAAPLMRLIRTNVIEGGRGFLGSDQVRVLNSEFRTADAEEVPGEDAPSFEQTISELFAEDSATRIYRTADLLRRGLLQTTDLDITSGRFSPAELRIIVPFLLKHPQTTYDELFWRQVGSMMTFEDLLSLSEELHEVDLTRLVRPNAVAWEARRMQLSLDAEYEEEAEGGWWVSKQQLLLGFTSGYRVSLSHDARKLKGRDGGSAARWNDISSVVDRYILESIRLQGVSRTISVSAENSNNVKRDVDQIQQTIDDQFHVTELTLRPLRSLNEASTIVNFMAWTATSEGGESVQNLTDVGLSLLGHRRPVDQSELLLPRLDADEGEPEA